MSKIMTEKNREYILQKWEGNKILAWLRKERFANLFGI